MSVLNGADSTLQNWIEIATNCFGEDSRPVIHLKNQAFISPLGMQDEVHADEKRFMRMLEVLAWEEAGILRKKGKHRKKGVEKNVSENTRIGRNRCSSRSG